MTGRVFWVAAWLYAIAWVLVVTVVMPVALGVAPLISFTFTPLPFLTLAPLVIGLLVAVVRRYDEGRPASRALSEREARQAVRPSPASVDVQAGGGPRR